MSKTIKYCPRCGFETENERDAFCPLCTDTDKPVKLEIKPEEAFTRVYSSQPEDNLGSAMSSQTRVSDSDASKQAHEPVPEYVSEAQRLQIEFDRKNEALKLKHQQESFIDKYNETLGDIGKVCDSVGITRLTFFEWLREDQGFAALYEDAKRKVERLLKEREGKEAEVKKLKKSFLELYRSNDCNTQRTCCNAGFDPARFDEWIDSDPVFAEKVKNIKREYDAETEGLGRNKMWARIKKAFLFLVAILILGVIGYKVHSIKADNAERKTIQEQYGGLLSSFDDAVSKVNLDDMGADALEKVAGLLSELKSYEDVHRNDLQEPKYSVLRQRVLNLCDGLFAYYREKATSLAENPSLNEQDVKKYRGLMDRVKILKSKI